VNYAGTGIGTNYQSGPLALGRLPGTIEHSYPNRLVTDVGDETAISVRLLDTAGEPLADRVVQVSQALDLYALPTSAVTDATGKATFNAVTLRSGYDTLLFTCEEAETTLNVGVNAIGTEKPSKPSANLSDFAVVASGTQLVLSCATEGAVLRYTLDDTCPCSEDALVYDGPITLSESVFIRIAAWTETGGYSERLNLHLTVSDAAAPAADLNEDGVVDTADVSALLVRVLFEEGSPAWDRNGDSKVDALDALSLMTDGSFTNAEERPEVFVAASYDQNGRLLGFRMVDLTQPLGSVSLSFLHTAPSVRFFYLDALCAPLANAFSYAPGSGS
nr:chitobiase/beta-hexosaminidase C-terminal domain-containing protein [Oscillospiraceae bacterium]